MKLRTIGCVELNSIAVGIHVADEMVKTAEVMLVLARTTCPGRYIAVVAGDTAAVTSSVQRGLDIGKDMVVDHFILASVHEDVIPALGGVVPVCELGALGVIETCTSASCIVAADAAAKAAMVQLVEIRFAAGLAGKAFVLMTGDVSSVEAGVSAGVAGVGQGGPVLSHVVIASPSKELKAHIV